MIAPARAALRAIDELRRARAFDAAPLEARRHAVRARLTRILERALQESAFYRARDAAGGHPLGRALRAKEDGAFFRAFAEAPPLTKDDLADRFDDLCTDPEITLERVRRLDAEHPDGDGVLRTRRGLYNLKKTSGTSGKIVYQVDTLEVQKTMGTLLAYRALLRTLAHGGALSTYLRRAERPKILVFVHRGNRSVYQGASTRGAPAWARALLDVHVVTQDKDLPAILAEAEALAPAFVFGLPSRVEWLAAAQLSGHLRIAPDIVFVGGETLHPSAVASFRRAWPDCRVVNTYGATETKPIALACPECGELHVCEDFVHLELVDASGEACLEGDAHAVFATSLRNFTVPVLRYELTDRITVLPNAGCRWRTRRIQVKGREPAFLWVRSRRGGDWRALNGRMLKEALCALEGACGFDVVHAEDAKLEVTVVLLDEARRAHVTMSAREAIDRFARDHGCEADDVFPRIDVDAVSADEWNRRGGKLQSIVSHVPRPEGIEAG